MSKRSDGTARRRTSVLLAVQRALLGAIGPNLRGVTVGWSEGEVRVRCLYSGPITGVDRESMNEVEAQLLGDFPEDHIEVALELYDEPSVLAERTLDTWVYCRREALE
jgi:hypothetical protein